MRIRVYKESRCSAIIQPGEFLTDYWDNKQCGETHNYQLIKCEYCEQLFCVAMHWHKHIDECAEMKVITGG